jgi:cysteinyl-tRNA synthetase
MRIRNTWSKRVEEFTKNTGDTVTFYSCGPTVYSFAHIGNFRSFLFADVLRRVLERRGFRVRHVMNITDVGHMTQDHLADAEGEDKLAKAARELGQDPYAVAAHFEKAFLEDAKELRLSPFAVQPRATRQVPEMLVMIQTLLDRGIAYLDAKGQAYFSVEKFPQYGALSGKDIDELDAGARVAVRDEKKDPRDFALWKVDDKHLMKWDPHSPAGWPDGDWERFRTLAPNGVDRGLRAGFPGWHIECSAMSSAHLGDLIDIHTGGEDNIFPHHECEIAQSWGATGHAPFARYWVHGRHLLVDGRKMSKRDGTFMTVRDLLHGREDLVPRLEALGFEKGRVAPGVLRYALISVQYGQPMNFTFDLLVQARSSVERLQSRWDRLREIADASAPPSDAITALLAKHTKAFDDALDDDLEISRALAAVFELASALNQATLSPGDAAAALATLEGFDGVLGVLDRRVRSGLVSKTDLDANASTDDDVVRAILRRHAAKKARDFATADAIRKELASSGVVLEDLPEGVRWKRP